MPHTPEPWEVENDREVFGRYTILKADHEEQARIDAGYAISDEEGDRRGKESKARDEGNRRLIQAAPRLLDSLQELSAWMRFHTRPKDGTEEMLTRALIAIEAAGEKPRDTWE